MIPHPTQPTYPLLSFHAPEFTLTAPRRCVFNSVNSFSRPNFPHWPLVLSEMGPVGRGYPYNTGHTEKPPNLGPAVHTRVFWWDTVGQGGVHKKGPAGCTEQGPQR